MTAAHLTLEIVRNAQRFAAVAEAWDVLAASLATPLACHAWYSAALDAQHGHRIALSVILVWDGIHLAAAAPLILDQAHVPARLIPIDGFVGEPFRLLYRDAETFASLIAACAGMRRPILFRRLVGTESDLAKLAGTLRSNSAVICKPRHASATVRLPDDFGAFEAAMSSSRRATHRRKWRAAQRDHGEIETEFATPNPASVPQYLARLWAIEGSGWKQRSGTALAADSRTANFVKQVAERFSQKGMLVLAFLKIGGRDAACRLLLQERSGWFEIKIGFEEEFARFSPGALLMHETLREGCRRGIKTYDFLGLYENWQDQWPHEVTADYRLASYPYRLSGALAVLDDCRQAAASFMRR
jgi:CelD/BcsL family acetyltransferase involved in cellulose biosynthesis